MAYIDTTEVAEIRKALKEEFGSQFKFSVRRRDAGLAVSVSIMAGDVDFSDLWENKNEGDYGYGYKSLNSYHLEGYATYQKIFSKIRDIIHTAPANAPGGRAYFDDSDSSTDYFHTAFYYDISVRKWDTPYVIRNS